MRVEAQSLPEIVIPAAERLGSSGAITLWDVTGPGAVRMSAHRGDVPIYPASIVKVFYLAAAHRWLEDGKLADSEELRRALREMVVDSSNDATHYVVDLLTGTTGGPELAPDEMKEWSAKRNVINRYFEAQGYVGVNMNQKTWSDGPFGRERVFLGPRFENRNALTTNSTARLLYELVSGACVSAKRSSEMMQLLERDLAQELIRPADQTPRSCFARALPPGTRIWSKVGLTSETRHDAAYLELPGGRRIILVIFTVGFAQDGELIPSLARQLISGIQETL